MNWLRHTRTGALNRAFLRCSSVYRCVKRYGAGKEWAVSRLSAVMKKDAAQALYESWEGNAWRKHDDRN